MKKLNKIKFSLLIFMIGIMNVQAQELALRDDPQTGYVKKKVEINNLKTLIKVLEPMYEVSIVCNSDLIHTKISYNVSDKSKSVEEHLSKMTSKSNLSYHKLDDGFYVITDKEEKGAINNDAANDKNDFHAFVPGNEEISENRKCHTHGNTKCDIGNKNSF